MNKIRIYQNIIPIAVMLAVVIIFPGCGGPAGPARKKMPEFAGEGNEFSTMHLFDSGLQRKAPEAPLGLSTAFTSMSFNGAATECISVSLPSATDQQALALIGLYKPFAATLINQWAKQQPNAVVLNFGSATSPGQQRSDYVIQSTANPDIPLIVLYDPQSSKRVMAYLGQVADVPGVSVKLLSSK